MGEVYRATDTKLERDVALKVLPPDTARDPERLARFQREARAVAALNHPHIVTIFSVEEADGVHFLTMELIEGQSLDRRISPGGLPAEQIIEIAAALADALSAAHEKNIVHRDLKPANVMVTDEGRVKVLDFGLAKDVRAGNSSDATLTSAHTQVGVVMGTPAYMSPEQISGRALDHRTDIFSLGVLLHEMCTGRRPFTGQSSAELTSAILRDDPPSITDTRSDLPSDLLRVIRRCLEKDPRHRIQTARDIGNEVRDLARTASHFAPTPISVSAKHASPAPDTGAARVREGFWVAVLPFRAAGADTEVKELADSLTEEIVAGLSRFSYLRVITHNSTQRYAGASFDFRTVGEELGARYVMTGNLRQAGARLRIAVQLVDSSSGAQLWSHTYERPFDAGAIFELQDDLAPRIVSTVADMHGVLPGNMSAAVRYKPLDQLTPYEALLRGFGHSITFSPDDIVEVQSCLDRALRQSPGNAECMAMLAIVQGDAYGFCDPVGAETLEGALRAAHAAVDAAPTNALAYHALAKVQFFRKNFPAFRAAAERAISLNPMDGATIAYMGILMGFSGDWERGISLTERGMQLNANHPGWHLMTAWHNAYRVKDYPKALELALKLNAPKNPWVQRSLTVSYAQLDRSAEARNALRDLLALVPDYAQVAHEMHSRWLEPELVEHMMDGLRKAGLTPSGAAVSLQSSSVTRPAKMASGESRADEGFWVAVLPFKYAGTSAELKALADGLSEESVAGLSRFSYLRVIAGGSTAKYSSESGDARAIGKELGARYVMEGSLRQAGTKLRVAVQLVDAVSGAHLWAENYERTFSPERVFELQDDLVPRIVSTVADMHGVLTRSMSESVRSRNPEQLSPYEAVLRSFGYFERLTCEDLSAARSGLESAMRKAPASGDAWAMLALLCVQDYAQGFNLQADALANGLAAAQRAVVVAPSNHLSHYGLAQALFFLKEFQSFRNAAERAVALNPMDGNSIAFLGELLSYAGDGERGAALAARAKQLNPNHPGFYWFADFYNAYRQGDYRAALGAALNLNLPGHMGAHMVLAAAYGQLGEREAAGKAVRDLLKVRPDFASIARGLLGQWWTPEYGEQLIEGWRKAGLEIADESQTASTQLVAFGSRSSGAARAGEGFWVAVLPFRGASGDADLEALADGLTEDVTMGFSRFPYLQVIAHNSAMAYKGRSADIRTVGRELGARYVIEGSIRKRGRAIRVSAQLMDAVSGTQLWAEAYDREIGDAGTFQVQDDLTDHIVTTVADGYGVLVRSMAAPTRDRKLEELSASELVLRYYAFMQQINPQEHAVLRAGLERALEREPNHATAWASLSSLYQLEYFDRFNPREKPLERAREAAWRAVKIDPACQMGWKELAAVHFFSRDFNAFRETAERAMSLNPRDGTTLAFMAIMIAFSGDWERGMALAQRAIDLNRHHPGWYHNVSFHHHYRKGEYEEALQAAKKINMPEFHWMQLMTAAACGMLGRNEEARTAIESLRKYNPTFLDLENVRDDIGMWDPDKDEVEQFLQGLQKAGLKYGSADSAATEVEPKTKKDPTAAR
jgi:TolB-like protein/Flp pilus assembly protein TadD